MFCNIFVSFSFWSIETGATCSEQTKKKSWYPQSIGASVHVVLNANSVGSDKCENADKCEPKNGIFGPFEHIFWFKFLIFGRSPPTPNFNGFTTKIPEMHVCAAHDCGRSWHVHRHPISASCSSRQSNKSCIDNKKVNRAFRSCARRKFSGALKHLVSRVIKIWAKITCESQITVKNSDWRKSNHWRK